MDDTMKVEFPLGSGSVILSRPTSDQLFAMAVLRKPREGGDPKTKLRFVERILRFLESLTGPDQWGRIEDDMLDGTLKALDVLTLFTDVAAFDWDANEPTPEQPNSPQPASDRPAPRVVGGA